MAITRDPYEAAYECAKEFHSEKIRLSDARVQLNELGINKNTAVAFVYALQRMLKGEVYKRALSEGATDDYLTWILRDYGKSAHNSAVSF